MKILVIGSGGREHALVWKLAQSPEVDKIYIAPGNAGTGTIGENVDIPADDIDRLVTFAAGRHISLVVVGPEVPLAAGIVDRLEDKRITVFGPRKLAAEIESSKAFSKYLMMKYGIPCAGSATFTSSAEAREYLKKQEMPVVIKADGLAAGKGVVIARDLEEALRTVDEFMEKGILGKAGNRIIVEEYLSGREMSVFVVTDGNTVKPLAAACDYKTVFDGNAGPNTGGMGSYSPPFFLDSSLAETVQEKIMIPTVRAMAMEGRPYRGVLYGGLMIQNGQPKVLEFNARFGDPETQVILPRLKTDLVQIMLATIENRLDSLQIELYDNACIGVVMASGGYPGTYKTGIPIEGLDRVDSDVIVFHAGTKKSGDGRIVTAGGRVLTVVATGQTLTEAREKVYRNILRIHFEGCHYRKDIGLV